MKKGQSGVSLIALVITIIVVIILAAVAFGTSTRTITNANWSTFTNAVGEVRNALQTRVTTVKGEEAAKGTSRSDAQVYNYVAKGATTSDQWLSRGYADEISATRIEPETVIKSASGLGLSNINTIKVNTPLASNREISYFVTRTGTVFVWPPYEYEDAWYVNDTTKLDAYESNGSTAVAYDGTTAKFNSIGMIKVGGVDVYVNGASETATNNISVAGVIKTTGSAADHADNMKIQTVYYKDSSSAAMPVGLETVNKYSAQANNAIPVNTNNNNNGD